MNIQKKTLLTVVKLITIVQGGRAKNKSTQPRGAFPNTYTREKKNGMIVKRKLVKCCGSVKLSGLGTGAMTFMSGSGICSKPVFLCCEEIVINSC